jgi:hypothetical protein
MLPGTASLVGALLLLAPASPETAAFSSAATPAQKTEPGTCPWCRSDPALMAAAGVVSHGPMPIGSISSERLAQDLPAASWIFLETAHLRWASSLGEEKVDRDDKERIEAELARLRGALPSVPKEPRTLDPWLRLHLFAMKGEEFYARFQRVLRVTDADFPAERSADGPFMGAGRFLGEKDKFEVVLHSRRATHHLFTRSFSGAQVTNALRWHFKQEHKLLASLPCEDSDLRRDRWLYPHVAHNLSHLFLCAYKHFSYDPPLWLDEGLALALEKEIDPRSTTNEGEEGSFRDALYPPDWLEAVRKMLARGRQPTLAELWQVKEVGALDREALFTCWSMVRYLLDERPEQLAKLLGGVKGQHDAQGIPSGSDLPGLQRWLFKELFGWTPLEFDEVWRAWAAAPRPDAK